MKKKSKFNVRKIMKVVKRVSTLVNAKKGKSKGRNRLFVPKMRRRI